MVPKKSIDSFPLSFFHQNDYDQIYFLYHDDILNLILHKTLLHKNLCNCIHMYIHSRKKMHLNMLNRYGPIYLYVHYIHTCTNICTYIYLINTYITYVMKVSREGHFTSRGPSKANYSAMILVRVTIVNWCSVILSNSSTITVRYSAVRRQSTLDSR